MSTGLRRMSTTKAEESSNSSSSESDQDVRRSSMFYLVENNGRFSPQVNRAFKEVDDIDGKKFTSKNSVNYYSRSSRSNY